MNFLKFLSLILILIGNSNLKSQTYIRCPYPIDVPREAYNYPSNVFKVEKYSESKRKPNGVWATESSANVNFWNNLPLEVQVTFKPTSVSFKIGNKEFITFYPYRGIGRDNNFHVFEGRVSLNGENIGNAKLGLWDYCYDDGVWGIFKEDDIFILAIQHDYGELGFQLKKI